MLMGAVNYPDKKRYREQKNLPLTVNVSKYRRRICL